MLELFLTINRLPVMNIVLKEVELFRREKRVGRRRANELDGAVDQERRAGLAVHRLILDGEIVHLQLGLHLVGDLVADVDRVTERLAVGAERGEGRRVFVMADDDRAGVLDLLQRAVVLLRGARSLPSRTMRQARRQTGQFSWSFSPVLFL